jgi:hypothetical protein
MDVATIETLIEPGQSVDIGESSLTDHEANIPRGDGPGLHHHNAGSLRPRRPAR